jgi:hypothetical protein
MDRLPSSRRRWLSRGATALAAVLIFAAVSAPEYVAAWSAAKEKPIYCVQRDQKMVSLTFDAAWADV